MPSKRQRARVDKARRHAEISPDELHPNIRDGLTVGLSAREALEHAGDAAPLGPSGVEALRHLRDTAHAPGTRVPSPRFVASDSTDSVWHDEPTGRLQRNAHLKMVPATLDAIREGSICLRCLEPQDTPFPDICQSPPEMGCTYPIGDRQSMDYRMEFEGDVHLGPQKPISAYLEEQDSRREEREFEARRLNGGRGITISQKILSPGVQRQRFGRRGAPTGMVPIEHEKKIHLPKGVNLDG